MSQIKAKPRRYHKGKHLCNVTSDTAESSAVIQAFQEFGKELDAKHDKYERIVKLGRDITIESKRLIFSLQGLHRSHDRENDVSKIQNALQKLLVYQFKAIALELVGEDPYQFLRAYSPGLQEFVEAVTLYHYLQNGELYNWNQFKEDLKYVFGMFDGEEDNVEAIGSKDLQALIPLSEYILGVQDLSGELMRLCIQYFAAGRVDHGFMTCNFGRLLYVGMLHLGSTPMKEFRRKQFVFKQSLRKMEIACYMMHVRGSEILRDTLTAALEESTLEEYNPDYF